MREEPFHVQSACYIRYIRMICLQPYNFLVFWLWMHKCAYSTIPSVSDYFDIPLLKPALILTNWRRFDIGVNSLKWSVYDNAVLVDNLFIQNIIMNLINYKQEAKRLSTENICSHKRKTHFESRQQWDE